MYMLNYLYPEMHLQVEHLRIKGSTRMKTSWEYIVGNNEHVMRTGSYSGVYITKLRYERIKQNQEYTLW